MNRLRGHLAGGAAVGDQLEDFLLAGRERRRGLVGAVLQLGQDRGRQLGGEGHVAAGGLGDRGDDLLHGDVLGEEARGAGRHGVSAQGVVAVHGEDHDRAGRGNRRGAGGWPRPRRGRAWTRPSRTTSGLSSAARRTASPPSPASATTVMPGVLERPAHGLAEELMVVGEQDPHQALPLVVVAGFAHADLRSDAC